MRLAQIEWAKDWKVNYLGVLCDIEIGRTPTINNPIYWNGQHTWVSIADMNERIVNDSARKVTDQAILDREVKLVKKGTLLLSFKLSIGKVAFAGKDLFTNEAIAALTIKDDYRDEILPEFLYWALQIIPLESKATFAVKGKTLNKKKMALIEVPYPDINTQQYLISRLNHLFDELKDMEAINNKIVFDATRFLDSMIADIFSDDARATWQNEEELKNVVNITASLINPTLPLYRDLPHINGEVIESGTARLLPYKTASEDRMSSNKYLFESGSVLYSKIRPYLRKVTIANFRGLCSADMYPLKVVNDDLVPEFLMWTILSPDFTSYAVPLSGRARMPKLNRDELFGYRIRYPDKVEQLRICDLLGRIRNESTEIVASSEKDGELLKQMEGAILAQAFRGKI